MRSETRYERYSRQMPLQTICATFEGRREPPRRVRRMSKPSSRDRRSRGSHLVKLFRPQNCGAVAHALAETGRVEDDRKLSRFHNGFYLQGDRSTTYAERAADCKLARLRAAGEWRPPRTDPPVKANTVPSPHPASNPNPNTGVAAMPSSAAPRSLAGGR